MLICSYSALVPGLEMASGVLQLSRSSISQSYITARFPGEIEPFGEICVSLKFLSWNTPLFHLPTWPAEEKQCNETQHQETRSIVGFG